VINKIFENVFIADPRKRYQIPLIIEELSVLPPALLKFVFGNCYGKIYLPVKNDQLFFIKNKLAIYSWIDGRTSVETSHADRPNKMIIIGDENDFLKNGYCHSVILHEFFHIIDYLFVHLSDKYGDYRLLEKLRALEFLDWYGCYNLCEKFAIAGEAFCHPVSCWSKSQLLHNRQDLYRKSPDIHKWFEQFFLEWERRSL
jgi:hypothetical protein